MIGLRRPGLVVISTLLAAVLLLAEYSLLINGARQRETERASLWGAYGLNTIDMRLQSALDFALVLTRPSSSGAVPDLLDLSSQTLHSGSPFDGAAQVQEVHAAKRGAFETPFDRPIMVLQNHRLIPSPEKLIYYPVVEYFPDDANGFALGLDLGATPGWEQAFTQARRSGMPMLAGLSEQELTNSRLDIIVALPKSSRFLLFDLSKDRLLDLRMPDGDTFLHHQRVMAWIRDSNDQPVLLFDSQPTLPSPATAPAASVTHRLGGVNIQLSAYSLNNEAPPTLNQNEWALLLLTVSCALLLLAYLNQLASRNNLFQTQLTLKNNQLEQNNNILRQQISERIHSEQARTESEMRQRAILQASSDAILLIAHDGTIKDINPSAARLIGQAPESVARLPVSALFSELYDNQHQRGFEAVAANFEGMPFEAQLIRSDSSLLPVELSLSRVILPDDLLFLVVCRDISIRKEHEAALIRLKNSLAEQVEMQSRQLAALLDASPLAMAYIVERSLKQVNHAFLELFDCDEARAINFTTRQFFLSDEQYERTGRMLYHLLNEGKVVTIELQLQTGQGTLIWVRLHGKALNPSVPGLGSIWLYQNFSSERAAEDALRAAKELAEETSRTKTEFLANMSHELRTPMHAILGFAEMGKTRSEQANQDKIQQCFERILSSGNRLLNLLNDLLDLSKMEVGRMEYHNQLDDMNRQIREACDELSFLAESNGIHIEITCSEAPLMLEFDAIRIGQVIRNLLSNAIKFSTPGGTIHVKSGILQGTAYPIAEVCVIDHGPGIPPHELETIFDKFIQSSTTKTGAGGTGLGLAICREIIHAHLGEIRAENGPEGGAIFSFTLPLRTKRPPIEDMKHDA